MQKFLSQLNIPLSCSVGNTIFKKTFCENSTITKSDEKIIKKYINKITWQYCLKSDTTNIQPFKDKTREYLEIEVITVALNSDLKTKHIAEIIMRNIPYPLLLLFSFEKRLKLYVAHQRQNLGDESKNTIEEFTSTSWFNMDKLDKQDKLFIKSIDFTKLSQLNFYRMYCNLVDNINIYNLSKLLGDNYITNICIDDAKKIYNQITLLDNEIAQLKGKIKKESAISERVSMNIKLNRLKSKRQGLLKNN